MRIKEVTATSFGPFVGEQLKPAPGLTVVWGLNEAGKSSWHSALHMAMCGLRRGRGANTLADRKVITRHQPWSGDKWRLGARITLDDGDELTVGWDLDAKIATVIDSLGRDRSNEWMHDGAVDLAKLVGLDRDSFLATASVRQSDLLGVQASPDKLQDLLQRAATAGGVVDATASAALETIDKFAQDNVGIDRSNSSKPLATAKRGLVVATAEAEAAKEDHRHRLELVAHITGLSAAIVTQERAERAIRAAHRVALAEQDLKTGSVADEELAKLHADLRELERQEGEHVDVIALIEAKVAVLRAQEVLTRVALAHEEVAGLQRSASLQQAESETLEKRVQALTAAVSHGKARAELAEAEEDAARGADADRIEQDARLQLASTEIAALGAELTLARTVAARASATAQRATELDQRHAAAPPDAAKRDDQAQVVHSSLERWAERPEFPKLTGLTSAEIEHQLSEIPARPEGDLQPAATVVEADTALRVARGQIQAHDRQRPVAIGLADRPGDADAIRALAERLAASRADPAAIQAELISRESVLQSGGKQTMGLVAGGALVAGVGVLLGVFVAPLAFILVLLGLGLLAAGLRTTSTADADPELAALRSRLQAAHAQDRDVTDAAAEAARLGLPIDAQQLRQLADSYAQARYVVEAQARWQQQWVELDAEVKAAEECVRRELSLRRVDEVADIDRALGGYRADCAIRAQAAENAAARPAGEAALAVRVGLEAEADRTRTTIAQAESGLRNAARRVGQPAEGPVSEIVESLSRWLVQYRSGLAGDHVAIEEWLELQQLVGNGSVDDLRAKALEAERRANELGQRATDQGFVVPAVDRAPDEAAQTAAVRRLGAEVSGARQLLSTAELRAAPTASASTNVSACQESVDAALSQLVRLAPTALDELQPLDQEQATTLRQKTIEEADLLRREQDQTQGQLREKEASLPDLGQAQAAVDSMLGSLAIEQSKRPLAADVLPARDDVEFLAGLIEERTAAAADAAEQAGTRRGQITERERLQRDIASIRAAHDAALADLEVHASGLRLVVPPIDPAFLPEADALAGQLDVARGELEGLRREASNLDGQLEERKTTGRDPAEAEEQLASARAELERVRRLEAVLMTTRSVLATAQERVHRDIAPRLNAAIDRWMPHLFHDRYQRVLIDPEQLGVKVLSGQVARDATALSQGTAEQIYLLLRIALVETLTAASNESCPMILDDITVHFDAERKVAVLDLLHEMSIERQVIIFSQEEAVRSWAQSKLGDMDNLIELPGRVMI